MADDGERIVISVGRPRYRLEDLLAGMPIGGEILNSHVRSIDTQTRPIVPVGASVPYAVLEEVRGKIAALIGFD